MQQKTIASGMVVATMSLMAKRKTDEKPGGRRKYKYVGLPIELYDELKAAAEADERSMFWVAKRAIREYLERLKQSKKPD